MDSGDPEGCPGVNREDGVAGPILTCVETGTDLEAWATSNVQEIQKDVSSASRLLFLTVEYVEEQEVDYERSAFAGFEPGTPFSPQQPPSLSEFEHRVSPLDPNMGSAARYSPVYEINRSSDSHVAREMTSGDARVSSNPSSPFESQVVVLTNPSSPLLNSTPSTLPSPHFTESSHSHSPSSSADTNVEITQGYVNHILSNPITASSSTDSGEGLLSRVVNNENYFHTSNTVLTSDLAGSPLNPNSPHSPLQADTYVVSSSSETLDGIGPRSEFHDTVTVGVSNSPNVVDSTSDMMIHSSTLPQNDEIVGATESPFRSLNAAGVLTTASDVPLKSESLDRIQLLISSRDGSIAYSLDSPAGFLQTRMVDLGNDLLSQCAADEQHLNAVINSFKMQGLVLGQIENGDLQLRPPQADEVEHEEKFAGTLGLQELTFALRNPQNELLQQALLAAPLNGDLNETVSRLGESLLNDVKISIVDPSLDAVGAYSDILMDASCVDGVIENEISCDTLTQESPEICATFDSPSLGKFKDKIESFSTIDEHSENGLPVKELGDVDMSSSFNSECLSPSFQSTNDLLSLAAASLPTAYLAIGKLPKIKAEDPLYGVFARRAIPKGTRFGPLKGILVDPQYSNDKQKVPNEQLKFLMKVEYGGVKKMDLSQEGASSWALFLKVASFFKEVNLILCQLEQSLFFITTRTVQPRQELKVWYSLSYAKQYGLPILHSVKFDFPDCVDPSGQISNWSCFKCNENFTNSVELQCHLNSHEFDFTKEDSPLEAMGHGMKIHPKFLEKPSKTSNSSFIQSQICVYQCLFCSHTFVRKFNTKKFKVLNAQNRKCLCEVCGHQFSHIHNSECRIKRKPKIPAKCPKLSSILHTKKILNLAIGSKKKTKSEWFCNHCNLTFDNPSICNLHTLAHAAENLKEIEGNPSPEKNQNVDTKCIRCPKCTKKMETSNTSVYATELSKEILSECHTDDHFNSLSSESILLNTSDSSLSYQLSDKANFMSGREIDIDTTEFLSGGTSEEDHQLSSVLNSFKIEAEKLAGNLDLQDIALCVRQPNDLLEQAILETPLNGDLAKNVVRFSQYDDVKLSIVDSTLDAVREYSDILIQSCVENVIGNELACDHIGHEPSQVCPNLDPSSVKTSNKLISVNNVTESLEGKISSDLLMKTSHERLASAFQESSVIPRTLSLSSASYVCVKKVSKKTKDCVYGVFARKMIPNQTRFGPIKGSLSDLENDSTEKDHFKSGLIFLVENEVGKVMKLEVSKKKSYNWIQLVRVASSYGEQNVVLSQQGQSLYFTTTKVIHSRKELKVWYGKQYAKRHRFPLLLSSKTDNRATQISPSTLQCFECGKSFQTSEALQYHLNIHILNGSIKNCWLQSFFFNPIHRNTLAKCCVNRNKRFSCRVCGYLFSSSHVRNRHHLRHSQFRNKKTNGQLLPLKRKLRKFNQEHCKNKNRTGWFCTHCNLTFDNPSICNLHTLAHAAENHEEAEIIVGLPNDLESVFTKVSKEGPEYRCPNCTKKVESSDCSDYSECDVSKVLLGPPNVDLTCSSLSHGIKSEDSNTTCNLNAQSSFISSREVNSSEEYLSQNLTEDGQLNSVFNSFRMRGLVIDDRANNKTQSLNSSSIEVDDTHSSEEQKETIGLREVTLAVQQQRNELVHQSLLSTPLNESVARLSPPLLSDDKISVVDPSLESVAGYSILMDSPCVSNVVGNKNSENPSIEESGSVCPDFILNCVKCKQESTDLESSTNNSCEMESGIKLLSNIENSNSFDSGCFSAHFQSMEEKSSLSLALSSLPISYLNISKLPHHKNEEPAYGVFARKTIPKRTQFGPIEGLLVGEIIRDKSDLLLQRYQDGKNLALLVESQSGTFQKLDVSQGKTTCWMQYVRTAQSFKEQNMILSQRGQSLFFTTTKIINPKQELRVWYSLPYANRRNLPLLQADVYLKKSVEGLEKIWSCFECNEKFVCSEGLQIHLNIHDLERDDGDAVDKNRAKRGNSSFRRKGVHFPRKYKCASEKHSEVFPYQCNTCHRAFPRNYNLKRHQLLHAKDKKYLCDVSGFQFSHLYNRDRHTHKRHKDNGNGSSKSLSTFLKKKLTFKSSTLKANDGFEWFCVQCNLTFDSLQILNLHSLSHGGFILDDEGLQCPQCSQEFQSKKKLVEHVADHGKVLLPRRLRGSLNPAKPWKCELCYKSFATEDRLQRHMLVHGAEESKPLQCDICYKRFLNNSALACHIKIHTAEKKMFECPICKIVFEQVLSLKEHVHSHSVNGLYTCPQCNKVFDGYSLIRKHIRAFHSDRKHTCNYCGKLFPKLDKLRMHMLRHSDHREFLCANCGKQFKRKDKLKEHMKRMHSVERELRLAMKPHRPPAAKKFMPKVQVSPTDYHRFIYKCHTCLLGFKRRGMLVNHLAKRHPDISPESVPELNLPILKTTRDYYCQYCEKVYKSSSKRKAHILKIHPGAELPMSNRRKGGVPEIPGLPNPTFSQTVGSITTHPHACPWCHKQYASKAKLLQHQRKKHIDLLPQSQQLTNVDDQESCSPDQQLILPHILQSTQQQSECPLTQLQGIENVINIIPGDYISSTDEELREFQESGIIIDTSGIERPVKVLPDGISADLLSQAMSELTNEFRVTVGTSPNDHYLRIVQTSPGHITVTQTTGDLDNQDKDVLACATVNAVIGDPVSLSPSSVANQTSTNLHQLLSESYSLPSSPSQSPSPQTWSNTHVTYTPFTAR